MKVCVKSNLLDLRKKAPFIKDNGEEEQETDGTSWLANKAGQELLGEGDYSTYTERRSASCIIDNTHCIVFSF